MRHDKAASNDWKLLATQTLVGVVRRTLRIAALSFFVALTGAFMFQDKLVYFPEQAGLGEILEPGLTAWPSAADFRGLIAEPAAAIAVRGTAIVFHGNAGHAGHRRYYADALTAHGLRVILAEYPGYGPRDGTPSEVQLVSDAAVSIALAQRTYAGPLLVIGESLGAGVAAAATAELKNARWHCC